MSVANHGKKCSFFLLGHVVLNKKSVKVSLVWTTELIILISIFEEKLVIENFIHINIFHQPISIIVPYFHSSFRLEADGFNSSS